MEVSKSSSQLLVCGEWNRFRLAWAKAGKTLDDWYSIINHKLVLDNGGCFYYTLFGSSLMAFNGSLL